MSRADYLMCRAMAADTGKDVPDEGIRFTVPPVLTNALSVTRFEGSGNIFIHCRKPIAREANDEIEIDGFVWRIEIGAGHAPEHACLYCKKKVLISGDRHSAHLVKCLVVPTELMGNPLQDWIDSCHRIREAYLIMCWFVRRIMSRFSACMRV